ncbi:MAG: sensor histidine kinase [Nitriliruptoraceae bacterium]
MSRATSPPAGASDPTVPAGAHPGRRVRGRLVLSVVALVATAALVLSLLAYVAIARSLRAEVQDRALEEARFTVEALAAERLTPPVRPGDIEASGLAGDLQRRGLTAYVDLGGSPGEDFVTGLGAVSIPGVVSADLRRLLGDGNLAAEQVEIDGSPYLVAAGRTAAGPDIYLLTDITETERTLRQLRLGLLAASGVLVLLGAAGAWRAARLSGQLADSVAELTAARTRERRFVADVSHELRTPLTALVGEADALRAGAEQLPPDQRRLVELLEQDVQRLRQLVEELLELSRLDAAAAEPGDDEPWDVEVARLLRAIADRRLPDAQVRVPAGLTVRTDRRRLERIVSNLLDNARTHADASSVTVTAHLDGTVLEVEVADRGPGVDEADLERIFDRFAKADRSRGSGGSGLGLAIAREHARVLGASLDAHNRDGGGLAVVLRLPVEVVTDL